MVRTTYLKKGEKYNRLTVIELDKIVKRVRKNGQVNNIEYYKCQCSCGKTISVQKSCLKNNHVKSCGCLNKEKRTKHNGKHTRLYKIWGSMKSRCFNINIEAFCNYGGRGITVCDQWKNDFKAFYDWAMSNGYKEDLTIDRIDVNGNYEPSNCRWATYKEQNNNRRTNFYIEYHGQKKTISDWARAYNIHPDTLRKRIKKYKWNVEEALNGKD